jgi:hypothetical protein
MFSENETDVLEKTYEQTDIITVALFYRNHQKTQKTSKITPRDKLIVVASYLTDMHPSCMLSWLGIVNSFPCAKPKQIDPSLLEEMQGKMKIGSFVICTCQWLVALQKECWILVICQVYGNANKGPLNFYKKMFFLQLGKYHQLIHQQYLYCREHIIDDDNQLLWMVLFQPIQYLLFFQQFR